MPATAALVAAFRKNSLLEILDMHTSLRPRQTQRRLPFFIFTLALVLLGFGFGLAPPFFCALVGAVASPLQGVSGVASGVTATLGCAQSDV
jgi:hypothetical protein